MNKDSKKREFYKVYGKHVLLIEYVLILTLTSTFFVIIFLPSPIVGLLYWIWLIAFIVAVAIHTYLFLVIVKGELCSYEVLRTERFRLYFVVFADSSFFLSFVLILVFSSLNGIPPEIVVTITDILRYVFLLSLPMTLLTFIYLAGSIHNDKRARLSLKTVLDAMESVFEEKTTKGKMKLIKKHAKWFRTGLRSYNSYLYDRYPVYLEIIDIEQYHRSICSIALMGQRNEIKDAISQIKLALDSIGGKEKGEGLRHFLIALKNIKSGKGEEEYPLAELNEMIRTLPFSDRVKERLKSPHVTLSIGIVAIVLRVLFFFWK